jgi:hypothetical protein
MCPLDRFVRFHSPAAGYTGLIHSIGVSPKNGMANRFKDGINLPGTLDDALIGRPVKADSSLIKPVMLHLSRKYTYIGAAWYQRTFNTHAVMDAFLSLERVLWRSDCWIDGNPVGEQESLIAPHTFRFRSTQRGGTSNHPHVSGSTTESSMISA